VGVQGIEADEASAARVRAGRARRIAERAYRGALEPTGEPVIAHVRRVAKASPVFARPVAWLHEVFEHSSIREEELLASGLTDEELRALRLLTRSTESRSEAGYLAHIDLIARSSGSAGDLARIVKRLDLEDRLQHPHRRADGWHPPYQLALELLLVGPATLGSEAGRDSASHETLGPARLALPDLATTSPQPHRARGRRKARGPGRPSSSDGIPGFRL
jgi:hypothetical protein